jgi:hypothetical protein
VPAAIDSRHAAAPRRLVACLIACVVALLGLLASGFAQPSPAAVSPGSTPPPADFTFAFAGSVSAAQRGLILRAVREVRPEARALLLRDTPVVRFEINRGRVRGHDRELRACG